MPRILIIRILYIIYYNRNIGLVNFRECESLGEGLVNGKLRKLRKVKIMFTVTHWVKMDSIVSKYLLIIVNQSSYPYNTSTDMFLSP